MSEQILNDFMLLVKNRCQAAESSTDHKCQQSGKEGIPREGPGEEEGAT
jgi:hypothetical protein